MKKLFQKFINLFIQKQRVKLPDDFDEDLEEEIYNQLFKRNLR